MLINTSANHFTSFILFSLSAGKCLTVLNENHKAHHILLLSTSILLNPFCPKYSSLPHNTVVDLIGKDIVVDVLAIEQAVLLYHICQIALESYSCNFTRYIFEVTRTICPCSVFLAHLSSVVSFSYFGSRKFHF